VLTAGRQGIISTGFSVPGGSVRPIVSRIIVPMDHTLSPPAANPRRESHAVRCRGKPCRAAT
jgi:hypothetical protein